MLHVRSSEFKQPCNARGLFAFVLPYIDTYVATLRSWAMSHNEVITELESRVLQFLSSPYDKAYKTSRGLGDKDIQKEIEDHRNPTPAERVRSLYGLIIRDYRDAGVLKNIHRKVVI